MVIFEVPFSSALELSEFCWNVVWIFGVYALGDVFVFDFRRLWPSGIVGLRALNHPAWAWGCMPIFSAFLVDVVVLGVP